MTARRAMLACAAALVAACADLRFTAAVDTIDTPITTPSWRLHIAPILGETCATSGACHSGANAALGLNLEPSQSYANVVNVASQANPAFLRVKPGDADSSFLYLVTSLVPAERQGYYRMPLTEYPLPDPVRQTIRNWINTGAPNN
jgi:hypothetical protein